MAFKKAEAAQAQELADFVNAAYRGEDSKRGWTTEADLLGGQRTDAGKIREMIQGDGSRIELLLEGTELLACVFLRKEGDGSCYLGMLTVDPARQGGGTGKRLLERSEGLAREWGCARMRMSVIHRREELLAYYERRGYRRTGSSEPFPEGDPRFGLPKVKGLRFLELVKELS